MGATGTFTALSEAGATGLARAWALDDLRLGVEG